MKMRHITDPHENRRHGQQPNSPLSRDRVTEMTDKIVTYLYAKKTVIYAKMTRFCHLWACQAKNGLFL
jgi:hypothetical protein